LFPKYGHLVISANLDGTVKLFDLYNDKRCLRTFYGHTKGVRDIQFNHDGSQFLSTSFDRTIKLWDTETGACIQRFSNRKLAYCVKFPPHARDQNQFIAGCSDNRVHQVPVSLFLVLVLPSATHTNHAHTRACTPQ
jgi:pre-mRNA-processing factor 17